LGVQVGKKHVEVNGRDDETKCDMDQVSWVLDGLVYRCKFEIERW
jgi:hypothetical protein